MVLPTILDVVATGHKEELDLVDKSTQSSDNPSVSSIRVVPSMDKTPSGERDEELCISEELNVTDDDDKGSRAIFLSSLAVVDSGLDSFFSLSTDRPTDEAFHSSTGSGYEQAINEAMMDETEYRARHFSAGASAMGPHQSGAARSRAMHSSFHRQTRHGSGSEPIAAAGRPQSSSPAPNASSPESRGQRVNTTSSPKYYPSDYHENFIRLSSSSSTDLFIHLSI